MEQHKRVGLMRIRPGRGVALLSAIYALVLAAAIASGQVQVSPPEIEPEFLAPLENQTVTQGREVHFTCVVNHLGPYKVAWIKSDSKAILAIHTHLVAHNPRLSVTHNGHNTWKLHVANVQKNDSGTYMCQINTDPMRSQMGHLDVVIPPDILNEENSADGGVAPEGGQVRLRCHATGIPEPRVSWKREDGRNITLRHDGSRERLEGYKVYHGSTLLLTSIQRYDMGGYLCIASNGVPPTVSKRFDVQVQFHPLIKVSNQLVAAPVDSDVGIQCYVEASPKAMNSWFKDTGEKLLPGEKYVIEEEVINEYALWLSLTIKKLEKKDFGSYVCASVNALGKVEGTIRLQELSLPARTTPIPIPVARPEVKPPRKKQPPLQHKNRKRKQKHKGDLGSDEEDDEAYDVMTTASWFVEPKTSLTINPSRPSSLWIPRQNEIALSSASAAHAQSSLPGMAVISSATILTLWTTRQLH